MRPYRKKQTVIISIIVLTALLLSFISMSLLVSHHDIYHCFDEHCQVCCLAKLTASLFTLLFLFFLPFTMHQQKSEQTQKEVFLPTSPVSLSIRMNA